MHYTGTIWRPPYEADSLIIEATAGCTHHRCKFCTLYEDLPFHMPRTLVKTQVGPPLGLSRRRAEGRACISGPGTPNRNRRPAEGAQSVGSFRSADTGLPAGPHFA